MSYNFSHCPNHIVRILIGHSMKHGKTEQPRICILCHRKVSRFVAETIAVVGMKMYWNIMHIHADVFRAQCAENLGAIGCDLCQIEANRIQMPRRVYLSADNRWHYPGKFTKNR